jgi:DNA processing protein
MEHNTNDRVVAHGLNKSTPKRIKYVAKLEENGGFMTNFGVLRIPIKKLCKKKQNRCGNVEATIVIESADRGGSLITATFNDYNRDVLRFQVVLLINTVRAATT